jgi:hypothetical protein
MRRASQVAIAFVLVLAIPRVAAARRGIRPLFEPTDLELEEPGTTELDVQVGLIHGREPWRLVIPDFEVDVGLLRNLEIDVDGAYALEAHVPGSLRFGSPVPDNLWLAAKVGLVDWGDLTAPGPEGADAWAVGLQAGPKLPISPDSSRLGVEGLVLLAHVVGKNHFAANGGAFYDPIPAPGLGRPFAVEGGLAFDRDLDAAGHYQVTASAAGVRFLSSYPNQLVGSAGLGWSPTPWTQVTLTGLAGFFAGSDRYGALLGLAQKVRFWGGGS